MKLTISTVFLALADSQGGLAEFYRQLFQREPIIWLPYYAEFELPGLRLAIFRPKPDHRAEFSGQAGSMSLCLEVQQLETAIQRLTELGCPRSGDITIATHGREVYVYDPAGNRLILHEAPVS